jgi:ribosomal protein S18 acetylase RimI-like enzyme
MTDDEYRKHLLEHGVPIFLEPKDRRVLYGMCGYTTSDRLRTAIRLGLFESGRTAVLILPQDGNVINDFVEEANDNSDAWGMHQDLMRALKIVRSGKAAIKGPIKARPGELFHVWRGKSQSSRPPSEMKLSPRVPKSVMDDEDKITPRVCLCTDVGGCFVAIPRVGTDNMAVFTNDKPAEYYIPAKSLVPDSPMTGEVWSLEPIHLVLCHANEDFIEAAAHSTTMSSKRKGKNARRFLSALSKKHVTCAVRRNSAQTPCRIVAISTDMDTDEDVDLRERAEDLFSEVGIRPDSNEELYEACVDADGEVVGASTFWLYTSQPDDGDPHKRPRYRFSVVVSESARRRGVAKSLVQSIMDANPRSDILLEGKVVNPHMARLLSGLGFFYEEDPDGDEWSDFDKRWGKRMYLPNPNDTASATRNSDESRRDAERRFLAAGEPHEKVKLLTMKVRAGEVPFECVRIAASLGDETALASGFGTSGHATHIGIDDLNENAITYSDGSLLLWVALPAVAKAWTDDFLLQKRIMVAFLCEVGRREYRKDDRKVSCVECDEEIVPGPAGPTGVWVHAKDDEFDADHSAVYNPENLEWSFLNHILDVLENWVRGSAIRKVDEENARSMWGPGGLSEIVWQAMSVARSRSMTRVGDYLSEAVFAGPEDAFDDRSRLLLIRYALGDAPVVREILAPP